MLTPSQCNEFAMLENQGDTSLAHKLTRDQDLALRNLIVNQGQKFIIYLFTLCTKEIEGKKQQTKGL